jgi:hypothetical protein
VGRSRGCPLSARRSVASERQNPARIAPSPVRRHLSERFSARGRGLVILIPALMGCSAQRAPAAPSSPLGARQTTARQAPAPLRPLGPRYRSDDSRAYALLEQMQAGVMPKIDWIAEFDAVRESECSALARADSRCADLLQVYGLTDANRLLAPTRYESVSTFAALQYVVHDLKDVLLGDGYLLPRDVAIGTVFSLCIEPSVKRVPDTESAVLSFKVGLFLLVKELVTTIVRFVPLVSLPAGGYHIVDSPAATRAAIDRDMASDLLVRFRDTLLALYSNSSVPAGLLPLDDLHQDLAGAILLGLERFAVAHELAHLALGHGKGPLGGQEITVIMDNPPLQLTRKQVQELEADNIGVRLTVQAAKVEHLHLPSTVAGAQLFLTITDLYEELYRTVAQSELPVGDHPTARVRLALMRTSLAKSELLPPKPSYDLGLQLADITNIIWQKLKSQIAAIPKANIAAMPGDICD